MMQLSKSVQYLGRLRCISVSRSRSDVSFCCWSRYFLIKNIIPLFSTGEDLLADTNTQPIGESDSAEFKEQHDACVRGQFLEKQKAGDYVNYNI